MPYKMKKTKGGKYQTSGPSGVHAKGTTKEKAEAQLRLLRGLEHGMKKRPTGSGPFSNADIKCGYKRV